MVSDFTPPVTDTGALAPDDTAPLIARPLNYSSSCFIDGLQVVAGSFHLIGSSHLIGHLAFHLLPQVTLNPEGIMGSSDSAIFPTFITQ